MTVATATKNPLKTLTTLLFNWISFIVSIVPIQSKTIESLIDNTNMYDISSVDILASFKLIAGFHEILNQYYFSLRTEGSSAPEYILSVHEISHIRRFQLCTNIELRRK